jgi:dTMP kinase
MKARLVTIDGGEGAGKSTVMAALTQLFEQRGLRWLQTREPGGTPAGEAMRQVLLNPALGALCAESELLLMFASRAQLVREVIQPALASGTWVLCDRFTDASFAYQGGGRDIDVGIIAELERWAAGMRPDLSLLLDLPVDTGLARVRLRGEPSDRIEREAQTFFERVRAAYRQRAASEPQRWRVIDASEDQSNVAAAARSALESWMDSLP